MVKKKSAKSKIAWWNRRLPLKFFWPLFVVLAIFFALSIFNIFSIYQVRREMLQDISDIKEVIGVASAGAISDYRVTRNLQLSPDLVVETQLTATDTEGLDLNGMVDPNAFTPPASEELLNGTMASFGDSFSGMAYIDSSQTNMFWDEVMTAFTFPPLYEVKKQSDCSEPDCGLSRANIDPQSVCLRAGCLRKTEDLRLFFNNKELKLPPALSGQTLSSITLFGLENSWLIGLVSGPASSERGWVYRFDGLAFSPLITNETEFQIKPRFERGGGHIAFGGDDDDFLALYSGYDGSAFRFRGNSREDVSRFFGLRITDGGFRAQILKMGSGQDSIFYICSVTENKPKVIKIWSKDDLNSGGALDFSPSFFRDSLTPDSILCAISDVAKRELSISSHKSGAYSLWRAQDRGFDNSITRQVTSINLNRKSEEKIKAAVLADVGAEFIGNYSGGDISFYLANRKDAFEGAPAFLWHGFESSSNELYWRIIANPSPNTYYSPWFNHINRLDYLFVE